MHRARILAWIAWDASGFFEWIAHRPWYSQILTDWTAAIPIVPGDRVLEVGCGPGVLSAAMQKRGVQMTGLEPSSAMVKRARRNAPECTFIEGDALFIPLPNAELDVAFASSVVMLGPNLRNLSARWRELSGLVGVFPCSSLL